MSLRSRLDRAFGLGPRDDPRVIAVEARSPRVEVPVTSTPGARVRLERSGRDGELIRCLGWLVRRGVPVELIDGEVDALWLDGARVTPAELKAHLGGAVGPA